MKRITIDFTDDVTPIKLSGFLEMLNRQSSEYIKHIIIDYFSEMDLKKKRDSLGDLAYY